MLNEKIEVNKFLSEQFLDAISTISDLRSRVVEKDRAINELNKKIALITTQIPKTNSKAILAKNILLPIGLNILTGAIFGAAAGFVFKQFMPF